jgi:hypothetical protein
MHLNNRLIPGLVMAFALAVGVGVGGPGGTVDAQTLPPQPGDWLVGDLGQTHNGVLYFDPYQASPAPISTLAVGGLVSYYNWVTMHPANQHLLCAVSFTSQFGIVRVPSGAFTTLVTMPDSPNGIALDQRGDALVSTSGGDALWRIDLTSLSSAVVARLPSVLNNVTVDRDTGELVVAIFDMSTPANGRVMRLSPTGQVLGTLASGLGQTSSVDWDPISGDFFVTTFDAPEVRRIDRKGVVTTVTYFRGANAVKVDEENGTLIVCGFNRTARYDASGKVLWGQDHSHSLTGGSFNWSAVEIYGSAKLSGAGPATPGSSYQLHVRFPRSGGRSYMILASVSGFRPGIALPDATRRVLSLAPDPLFYTLLLQGSLPGLFNDFRGVLDSTGRPVGRIPTVDLPVGLPKGSQIYFAALALNPTMSSGIDISNPWTFIIP